MKYYLLQEFEVEGDGSYDRPFEAVAGTSLRHYAYLALLKNLDSGFFNFGFGTKAYAAKDSNDRWIVTPIDKIQVSPEKAAAFMNEGLDHEHFEVGEAPENPVVVSREDLKILADLAYAAGQLGAIATPEETAVVKRMSEIFSLDQ